MKIEDEHIIALRDHPYLRFWYIVEYSLKRWREDKDERGKAFLHTAVVMAVASVEAILNDIGEFYLPKEIFDKLDKEMNEKKRINNFIKHLSGQEGEFKIPINPNREMSIKKVDIGSFFKSEEWQGFVKLLKERNKIIHHRTEDMVSEITNSGKIKVNISNAEWKVNNKKLESYIESTDTLLVNLSKIFQQSICDYIPERLTSRFDFLKVNG